MLVGRVQRLVIGESGCEEMRFRWVWWMQRNMERGHIGYGMSGRGRARRGAGTSQAEDFDISE